MKIYTKKTLIASYFALLFATTNASAVELNVATAQEFQNSYKKIIAAVTTYSTNQGMTFTHEINNFEDKGTQSRFVENSRISFPLTEKNILNILSTDTWNATHDSAKTTLQGTTNLIFQTDNMTLFSLQGESTGSLDTQGNAITHYTFKNIDTDIATPNMPDVKSDTASDTKPETTSQAKPETTAEAPHQDTASPKLKLHLKADHFNVVSDIKLHDDLQQLSKIAGQMQISNANFTLTEQTEQANNQVILTTDNIHYIYDQNPSLFNIGHASLNIDQFNLAIKPDEVNMHADSLTANANAVLHPKNNNAVDFTANFNIRNAHNTGKETNQQITLGDLDFNATLTSINGKKLEELTKIINQNPTELPFENITEMVRGLFDENSQFNFSISNVFNNHTARLSMNFVPSAEWLKLVNDPTQKIDHSPEYISSLIHSFNIQFELPKTYFIERGLQLAKLNKQSELSEETIRKNLENQFTQFVGITQILVPAALQPIIKFENDVISSNISLNQGKLNINGTEITVKEALSALE